jgi:hypothetical protein
MSKRYPLSEESMTIFVLRFLSMLNLFLTGSTLENQGSPLKIKKPKIIALRIADIDISSGLWFYFTQKYFLGTDL